MICDHISVFLPCFLLFVICGTDSQYVPMLTVTPLDPRGSGLLFFMFITWFIRPQPYTTCLGIECPTVHPDTRQPICRFTVSRPRPLFRLWFHPRCTGVCIFVPCGILLRWCPRVLRASEWSDGRSDLSSVARVCLYYIVPLNVRGHHRRSGGSVSLITLYQVTVVSLCSFYVPRLPDRHVPAKFKSFRDAYTFSKDRASGCLAEHACIQRSLCPSERK